MAQAARRGAQRRRSETPAKVRGSVGADLEELRAEEPGDGEGAGQARRDADGAGESAFLKP